MQLLPGLALNLTDLARQVFPAYQFKFKKLNVRYTFHEREVVHFDNIPVGPGEMLLRAVVNLDSVPRLWANSYSLDQFLYRHWDWMKDTISNDTGMSASETYCNMKGDSGNVHPEAPLVDKINFLVQSSSIEDRCQYLLPRKYVSISSGSVLFGEPTAGSHTVMWGRRALTLDWTVTNRDSPVGRMVRSVVSCHHKTVM